jgi:4-carboxymuconolactone decarboxylase
VSVPSIYENAVLGDPQLLRDLRGIDDAWGELVGRCAGEVWGKELIDQKTKAFLVIATDVVNTNVGPAPYYAHLDMAFKQGITVDEIRELLLFMSIYAGFNKVATALLSFKEYLASSASGQANRKGERNGQ